MKFITFLSTMICLGYMTTIPAWSEENGFATSKEGIINGLTREMPEKPRTRGLTRGLSRGYSSGHTESNTHYRGFYIQEKCMDQIVEKKIMVPETDITPHVNLTIEFDRDSSTIRPVSFSLLDELGQALSDDALAEKSVIIIGHADADGPDDYNLDLSMNRALAVKYYLQGRFSIPGNRVRAVGFGEAKPIVANTTPTNKQKNRRVEVRLDQGMW